MLLSFLVLTPLSLQANKDESKDPSLLLPIDQINQIMGLATAKESVLSAHEMQFITFSQYQNDYEQSREALKAFLGIQQPGYYIYNLWVNRLTATFFFNSTLRGLNIARENYLLANPNNIQDIIDYELITHEIDFISKMLPNKDEIASAKENKRIVIIEGSVWEVLLAMKLKLILARGADFKKINETVKEKYLRAITSFEFKYFGVIEYIAKLPGAKPNFNQFIEGEIEDFYSMKSMSIMPGKVIATSNMCLGYLTTNAEFFKKYIRVN